MKLLVLVFICSLLCSSQALNSFDQLQFEVQKDKIKTGKAVVAQTYDLDLDLPPKQRWTKLAQRFDRQIFINGIHSIIDPILKIPLLIKLAEDIAGRLDEVLPQPYADEMRGLAADINIPLGQVVLINLAYDVSAFADNGFFGRACTSIVTLDKYGKLLHGRNMDYSYVDFLSNVSVTVNFMRGGKVLYTGTTFAGYIGLLTARKPNMFSLSGDERDQGQFLDNILAIAENHWPTLLMAREVVDKALSYDEALEMLVSAKSIAPMYFILGGIEAGQGSIIVHGRNGAINVTNMIDTDHQWFVLETNYEPWEPAPKSDDRRDAGIKMMKMIGQDNMDAQGLYKVLSSHLVFNKNTIYTTLMSTTNTSFYETFIRFDRPKE